MKSFTETFSIVDAWHRQRIATMYSVSIAFVTLLFMPGCGSPNADEKGEVAHVDPQPAAASRPTTTLKDQTPSQNVQNPWDLLGTQSDHDTGFESTIDLSVAPDHGAWQQIMPGVDSVKVKLGIPSDKPGNEDQLILYVPHGETRRHSLGCVFIAPAGSPIFAGNTQGDGDRVEHVPYVKAGYAVVAFEIDGPYTKGGGGPAELANINATYAKFKASGGGVVNGKNALEYTLAKMPEVDPERLYSAGHSSAAIWSLLFAEHEPRIKGCIAYAPVADLFGRIPQPRAVVEKLFPGIVALSPQEAVTRLKCPVFLFHAEDDTNVPIALSRRFVDLLKQTNSDVTFHTVPSGGHYDSMIAKGVPQGVAWLKARPGESAAK